MKLFGGSSNNKKSSPKRPVSDDTAPIRQPVKNPVAGQPLPKAVAGKPGAKKKKRLKPQYIALIVVGVLLVLALGVYGFLKIYAKPPDVSQPDQQTAQQGEEDPYADLVAPFIDDGSRARKDDYYTFMICGTDNDGTRTDTIIVASYDVKNQQVNLVNVPRDTMSNVRRTIKKINGAFNNGPEQLEKELEMLLGIPIDRYVVVDFQGFEELIDLIGGVDFDVPTYMVWDDPTQDLHIYLEPGMQHLDGEKAIQLMRFRQNNPGVKGGYAEGDIGRIKMQQEFLQAVAKKLLSPQNLLKVGDLASAVLDNTETNLSLSELTWFGMKALNMDFNNISMSTLPGHSAYLYEPDYGHMQSYYVPEEEGILDLVNQQLNPYEDDVTTLNLIDVSQYSSQAPASSGGTSSSEGKDDEPPASTGSSGSDSETTGSGGSSTGSENTGSGSGSTETGGSGGTESGAGETGGQGGESTAPEQPPESGGENTGDAGESGENGGTGESGGQTDPGTEEPPAGETGNNGDQPQDNGGTGNTENTGDSGQASQPTPPEQPAEGGQPAQP